MISKQRPDSDKDPSGKKTGDLSSPAARETNEILQQVVREAEDLTRELETYLIENRATRAMEEKRAAAVEARLEQLEGMQLELDRSSTNPGDILQRLIDNELRIHEIIEGAQEEQGPHVNAASYMDNPEPEVVSPAPGTSSPVAPAPEPPPVPPEPPTPAIAPEEPEGEIIGVHADHGHGHGDHHDTHGEHAEDHHAAADAHGPETHTPTPAPAGADIPWHRRVTKRNIRNILLFMGGLAAAEIVAHYSGAQDLACDKISSWADTPVTPQKKSRSLAGREENESLYSAISFPAQVQLITRDPTKAPTLSLIPTEAIEVSDRIKVSPPAGGASLKIRETGSFPIGQGYRNIAGTFSFSVKGSSDKLIYSFTVIAGPEAEIVTITAKRN